MARRRRRSFLIYFVAELPHAPDFAAVRIAVAQKHAPIA
jgi:hypothetical protein